MLLLMIKEMLLNQDPPTFYFKYKIIKATKKLGIRTDLPAYKYTKSQDLRKLNLRN